LGMVILGRAVATMEPAAERLGTVVLLGDVATTGPVAKRLGTTVLLGGAVAKLWPTVAVLTRAC